MIKLMMVDVINLGYIECICVIYAMDFLVNMSNISYLYYWYFIEMN